MSNTVAPKTPATDPFSFCVVPGQTVRDILADDLPRMVDVVRDAYLAHEDGKANNPPSHFLRFQDRPTARIISLAADLSDADGIAGMKWIASWPDNTRLGIPRASAVLVLNRHDMGYPFCIMEASIISAVRTAASAVLGMEHLRRPDFPSRPSIGFVGCGLIARYIFDMIMARKWRPVQVTAFDLSAEDAARFLSYAGSKTETAPSGSMQALIRESDIVIFATTAANPHVHHPEWLAHRPLVLNISLRDLAPEVILAAQNVVDDIDHCLQADTSPHLAEKAIGHRRFIHGTIAGAVRGRVMPDLQRPIIYSPFGMGILDLAVGRYVHELARRRGQVVDIPDFFAERRRW